MAHRYDRDRSGGVADRVKKVLTDLRDKDVEDIHRAFSVLGLSAGNAADRIVFLEAVKQLIATGRLSSRW